MASSRALLTVCRSIFESASMGDIMEILDPRPNPVAGTQHLPCHAKRLLDLARTRCGICGDAGNRGPGPPMAVEGSSRRDPSDWPLNGMSATTSPAQKQTQHLASGRGKLPTAAVDRRASPGRDLPATEHQAGGTGGTHGPKWATAHMPRNIGNSMSDRQRCTDRSI
jgi:hypothetical protein